MDEQALQSECKPKAITECSIKFRWTKSQERKYLTTWFFFFSKEGNVQIRITTCNENSCHESLHDEENNIKICKTRLLEIQQLKN